MTWGPIRLLREAKLNDDYGCAEWCFNAGLLNIAHVCSKHDEPTIPTRVSKGPPIWRCCKCNNGTSIFNGSIFERSNLSIGEILMIVLCFAKRYNYEQTREALIGIKVTRHSLLSDATIAFWFNRFKQIIFDTARDSKPIGGPGIVVQIDEALIGRRKYNRGRCVPGRWVLGMIDADGNIRLRVIFPRRNAKTLLPIIQELVAVGSVIHTDCWSAYNRLSELGYVHKTVNHSETFVAPAHIRSALSRNGAHCAECSRQVDDATAS